MANSKGKVRMSAEITLEQIDIVLSLREQEGRMTPEMGAYLRESAELMAVVKSQDFIKLEDTGSGYEVEYCGAYFEAHDLPALLAAIREQEGE